MAIGFYSQLFTSSAVTSTKFLTGGFPHLEQEQEALWEQEVSTREIKKALGEMGSWMAPGPDGYQPGFFKKTREVTGTSLCRYVMDVLQGGDVSEEDAEALLMLIPKGTRPVSLKGFRPISQCNASVKLVSKAIAD